MAKTRVVWDAGEHAGIRTGLVDGYVQIACKSGVSADTPNIWAIVIDSATGTLCAKPIYELNADGNSR